MGISSIGIPGLIIILVVVLLLFGPSKLPALGRAVGGTLREFKDSTKGIIDDEDADLNKKNNPPILELDAKK